jgi:hypothetical protein
MTRPVFRLYGLQSHLEPSVLIENDKTKQYGSKSIVCGSDYEVCCLIALRSFRSHPFRCVLSPRLVVPLKHVLCNCPSRSCGDALMR